MSSSYFLKYNQIIKSFEDQLTKLLFEYTTIRKKKTTEQKKVSEELQSSLSSLEKKFNKDHDGLKEKFELLKAEVYRYRFIFKDGTTKFGKLTPAIDARIKQLEEAIFEHIDLKVLQHANKYEENKKKISSEYEALLHDIKIKIEILEDDYYSKLNSQCNAFTEKNNKEVSTTKGTALVNSILNFSSL